MAELSHCTPLTANGDEIDCAKAAGKLRRVIQLFLPDTRHFEKHINGRDTFVRSVHPNRPGPLRSMVPT
jgi:hypothetical protein